MGRLQVNLIDIFTNPDGEYIWILHLKDHSLKFIMLYSMKNKNAVEIAYYIGLFVYYLSVPKSLQYDSSQDFKDRRFLFLKKYNIKLINSSLHSLYIKTSWAS